MTSMCRQNQTKRGNLAESLWPLSRSQSLSPAWLLDWIGSNLLRDALRFILANSKHPAYDVGKTALAITALASALFGFSLCLFAPPEPILAQSSYGSAISSMENIPSSPKNPSNRRAAHLSRLHVHGPLETMLIFSILQASISLYQARSEFSKGRWIEGASKTILGCARVIKAAIICI